MSWGNRRTMAAGAAAVGALALLTAACGGGSSPTANANSATTTSHAATTTQPPATTTTQSPATTTTQPPATTTTARPTTTTAGGTTNVTASETEYKISLSQKTFHPGNYVFKVVNNGTITHGFLINGPGVSNKGNGGDLNPGQSTTVYVTLQAGTYELYCPVDSHKALGMDVHITVS